MTQLTRRAFLGTSTSAALASGLLSAQAAEEAILAGAASDRFAPVPLKGNATLKSLADAGLSEKASSALPSAPQGPVSCWGIPFHIDPVLILRDEPVTEAVAHLKVEWLVFMHTVDLEEPEWNRDGFLSPMRGMGRLKELAAEYVVCYSDGSEERLPIRRRLQIHVVQKRWGECPFEAVNHSKPYPIQEAGTAWGRAQTRTDGGDRDPWQNWLWAWQNPHPDKPIAALRFEPKAGTIILSAISAGTASSHPLRWETRRKAILRLPDHVVFDPTLRGQGQLQQIRIDMGQVISAEFRRIYPNDRWVETENNQLPEISTNQLHVEYVAHRDARFHLEGGVTVPAASLLDGTASGPLTPVAPALKRIRLRVVDKKSRRPVPVRLHVHGESGEYLAPVEHHRYPNIRWFEDYAPGYNEDGRHYCVYIPGETVIDLPLGNVYLEVSKGFEIRPIRRVFEVQPETEEIHLEIEKVLPWRERGWVTADTHVHFLSPSTAQLEGCAEGVNVVNLLAAQWGELMTNVGDFDGKTTFGSKEAGGDGEWLVRVGTENRNHVLGHISLIGYSGNIIAPMSSGVPYESAIGTPVEILLTEWAEKCQAQGGLVFLPHFPDPRAEHAASIMEGRIDGVELCSDDTGYQGIEAYCLSDYYRYLNCGYYVPLVGGTDKMTSSAAVGRVRTYTRLPAGVELTYETWKEVTRKGQTFVTFGPLMEFSVDGKPPGSWIEMSRGGGTVDVSWELASVTVRMTRVDLVVNGEIRERLAIDPEAASGNWKLRLDRSSWVALLVRGRFLSNGPEAIMAHSSPVMIKVESSEFFAAADAVTILDQIEGTLAYLDTVGTRADTEAYKRMRLRLTSAYRELHHKLHQAGHYHEHTAVTEHD